jgi:hypothetical protein
VRPAAVGAAGMTRPRAQAAPRYTRPSARGTTPTHMHETRSAAEDADGGQPASGNSLPPGCTVATTGPAAGRVISGQGAAGRDAKKPASRSLREGMEWSASPGHALYA